MLINIPFYYCGLTAIRKMPVFFFWIEKNFPFGKGPVGHGTAAYAMARVRLCLLATESA